MTNEYKIASHVPLPMTNAEREQQRLFKAYWKAYQECHVRQPVLRHVTESGYFVIDVLQNAVNAKRLKELTNMLRARAKEQR